MVTTVSCGHWGTHLDHHLFLHHSKQRGLVVLSHLIKAVSRFGGHINSFISNRVFVFFSDRMHRIHPCGVVFFSPLLLAFNLINNNGVIFRSDYGGFICWSVVIPIVHLGFGVGNKILSTGIVSQLYVCWYGYDTFCMHGIEDGLHLLFFVFFLSLCHWFCAGTYTLCLLFVFQLFTTYIVMALIHHHCIFFFSALHHGYCNGMS